MAAETKTRPTDVDVDELIAGVDNAGRREDAAILLELMTQVTGERPVVWGTMIGFGNYHYKYESGREGDSFVTGFAPRRANMVVYLEPGFEADGDRLARLGKHKLGKSCLYLGRLKDVDLDVLREIVADSVEVTRQRDRAR